MVNTTLVNIDPDKNAKKFYNVRQDGSTVHLKWGRIGTDGQTQTKTFGSTVAATMFAREKVWQKVDRGYVKVG